MAFHRVAVNIDSDRTCATRVAFAAGIARRFGAELAGVYARLPNPAGAAAVWPALPNNDVMDRLRETHSAEVDAHIGRLRPQFEAAAGDVPTDWLEISGDRAAAMIRAAQAAALLVVAQPDEGDPLNYLTRESVSDIVMGSGRPVLFHPYIGADSGFRRILVAWDGSREAVRAFNDAAPFMDGADVLFLTVAPDSEQKASAADADRLTGFAGRMGARASFAEHIAREIGVSDVVMSRAADHGADLVVMGGYSHSRFRELILGGATRDILDQMPVPVLMSH
ncbi:MAG: universal stress protein [Rhodospirillaceae bacterium]|nr:universal stress protein [Rhodospirillaceae bacterium]